ncbi:MAG: DUF4192 domain-containing protein [Streptosporangiaceae bacterium]|jgi:hypothetical protein
MTQTLTAGDESPQNPQAQSGPPDDLVPVTADSPAALLALVPHLLGFVPEASFVMIGIDPSGHVKVTLRYDLPDPAGIGVAADVAGHAVAIIGSQGITTSVAVGYGPGALVDMVAAAVRDAAREAGVDLREFLRVENGRYWSYVCRDEACCPAAGVPFGASADSVPATPIALAPARDEVLPGRAAVAARIAPLGGVTAESMRQATRRAERHVTGLLAKARTSGRLGSVRHLIAAEGLAAVSSLIGTYRAAGRFTADYQLARMTVALRDLRVRDDAWARMDPAHRDAHRRLWIDVTRRAQPGYVAAPAALLAFVAWQSGDGALANVALDRALADDPRYSMALLLRQVITAGAPPSLARLPMTPEEVAASYDDAEADAGPDAEGEAGEKGERAGGAGGSGEAGDDHDVDLDVHHLDADGEW